MPIDNIYFSFLLLGISLLILMKAADYFNKGAEKIGLSFGLSPFIIGILIVAFGTSLPELISSVIAVVRGASEIVTGNVLGSNVTNIFLILGLVLIIHRKTFILHSKFINVDLQFLLGSALFIAITIVDGEFNLFEGLLCIAGFIVYVIYLIKSSHPTMKTEAEMEMAELEKPVLKDYLIFIGSGVLVYVGAEFTIRSVTAISDHFEISKDIIAASTVALGTSLPELIVSIDAVKKGKTDYAMGNILGSSIFNAFLVMGFSSLFGTITVPDSALTISLPFMLIATFIYFIITRDKRITQWEGMLFLLFYILFISKLFNLY